MKLFKYEGYNLTVEPEALLLQPFRKIWNRDRSKSKQRALFELGFIYFFCDPRSDYMYITNEELRKEKIKEMEGLPDTWKPDKVVEEGVELYKELTHTTSFLLLQDSRVAIDRVREELRNVDMEEEDGKGNRINTNQSVLKSVKEAISLLAELDRVEREINQELRESSQMRGQGEKTIMEDEIDI